ncbi:TIGR04570 family membrane protein [Spiroplasma sp. ChiS]|uniref:TIGR04570 family membrane protein n=1 Tax=Spiroplasma sp. ChiS TaxID=2099885 RepID=UPI000CF967FC|nr:TIGR04570 family membrane protein [Spiroplasma sp. ChiS]PQP79214.1 TIGR04570 family membrane protein [Spiroplasma sp. ChiS]
MNNFSLTKEKGLWQKIFKKIPWFYHVIFLMIGIVAGLLFQFLYIKRWDFPYFFIFIIAIIMLYCVLFLLFSPIIKQNWFLKKGFNEK